MNQWKIQFMYIIFHTRNSHHNIYLSKFCKKYGKNLNQIYFTYNISLNDYVNIVFKLSR